MSGVYALANKTRDDDVVFEFAKLHGSTGVRLQSLGDDVRV